LRTRLRDEHLYRLDWPRLALICVALVGTQLLVQGRPASPVPPLPERLRVLERADEPAPEVTPDAPPGDDDRALIAGAFERGDTILSLLARQGVGHADAMRFVSSLGTLLDFRHLKSGDRYRFQFDEGTLHGIEIATSPLDVYVARLSDADPTGPVEVSKQKIDTVRRVARLGCVLTDSLAASVARCGGDERLARRVIDLLGQSVDFYTDLRYGDEIRILAEKLYVGDEFVDWDRVLAVEYAGEVRHQVAYYYESPSGDWEYYNESGESVRRMFLRSPLKYRRISSGFDPKRFHPVLHKVKAHLAIDYAAPTGTPVWAWAGGVVTFVGRAGAAGNMVKLKHKDGYQTLYGHLNKFKKNLKTGDRVNQGDVIGYVGATGRATGPHLHFAVKLKGAFVNPFKLDNPPLSRLADQFRPHFDETVQKYREQLEAIPIDAPRGRRTS